VRPRIGITSYWRAASWGPWTDFPATLVPQGYVEGVRGAGGIAVLIPPDPGFVDDASAVLAGVDGLLLVGGEDIGASTYGTASHPAADAPNVRRDTAELALLKAAIADDLPVLGVCRGFQLMNILYGGDLVQEIAEVTAPAPHRERLGAFGRHPVAVSGGRLRELVGDQVASVHSHHHQSLGRVGEGLIVTATAPDGLVEAVEDPTRSFCVGILWHPEEAPHGDGAPLFRGLVDAARARVASR
jgi:putative glutamine amidotransferase